MLVLSRKICESILFPGTNTAVQVLSVKGNVVRLGIEAPPEVSVIREELQQRSPERTTEGKVGKMKEREGKFCKVAYQLRDRLKNTAVGFGTVDLLLAAGQFEAAKELLGRVRDDFQILRFGLEGELEDAPPMDPPARKATKALLVEDDPYQRDLLAGFLRKGGLEVDTVGDGCDALDYLRQRGRPDVVLLDMAMPRCDGPTTLRTIRNDPTFNGLRIFAVTGRSPEELNLGDERACVDRWFQKPFNPTALLHDLTHQLESSLC